MAISPTQTAICEKMSNEFDAMIETVRGARDAFARAKATLISLLNGLSFSTPQDLLDAINGFLNDCANSLPNSDAIDEILDMINNCNFLSNHDSFSNPISLITSAQDSIMGDINNKMDDLAGSIPEFSASKAMGDLLDQLTSGGQGMGITDSLKSLDSIINCIDALCGSGFSSRVSSMSSQVDGLFSDFGLDSDPESISYGELDMDSIYSAAGISGDEITAMEDTVGSMTDVKGNAEAAVSDVVGSIKDMF